MVERILQAIRKATESKEHHARVENDHPSIHVVHHELKGAKKGGLTLYFRQNAVVPAIRFDPREASTRFTNSAYRLAEETPATSLTRAGTYIDRHIYHGENKVGTLSYEGLTSMRIPDELWVKEDHAEPLVRLIFGDKAIEPAKGRTPKRLTTGK